MELPSSYLKDECYQALLALLEAKRLGKRDGIADGIRDGMREAFALAFAMAKPMAKPLPDSLLLTPNSVLLTPDPLNLTTDKDRNRNTPADKKIAAGKVEALGAETWEAYRAAYNHRYRVDPVRNRQLNSHLKQLVEHLGAVEAPQVAAFYLSCSQQLYVNARHQTNLLIRDYAALRTQMATGIKVTRIESKSEEQKDNVMEQFKRITDMKKKPIDITPTTQGVIGHDGSK